MTSRVPWDPDSYLALARRACFVCELLAGNPDYPHHVAYRDGVAIVFASRFPSVTGHFLVAPVEHREHVIADFTPDEYAAIQNVVHRAGSALSSLLPVERSTCCRSAASRPTGTSTGTSPRCRRGCHTKISRSPCSRHLAAISTCLTTRSQTSSGGSASAWPTDISADISVGGIL
ncbi:hypothetical protein SK854_46480 [Lentzea sp. BCCO 10_0061]|uniref:HIT domain-containing protein n=1 Tax=Lentzea sokolovensis TaxID=3095429 RepID=A0ABU4VD60_9PSEU|nr:hypothetical protein [Lentzea sp. BCCO 10_0061]MDX8149639.1 hypothetical protein [Lentzea sp. BCCO 10_0061]